MIRNIAFLVTSLFLVIPSQAYAACDPNIPADITADCKVDFNDFAVFAADWLQTSDMVADTMQIARYNAPPNDTDIAYAIAVDANNNIYVTGESTGSGTFRDYATIKYPSDSNQPAWIARYDGPAGSYDEASAIAVDSNNNIYVTGGSTGSGTFRDYATIKYSPDSNQPAWIARYDGPAGDTDKALAIAIDSNNNIYVTGYSYGSGTSCDYLTIKYSPDSNQPVWIARYNGPDSDFDAASAIALDSNDNIYVTGRSYSSLASHDYLTIKYSPDSNQPVWIARYDGPAGSYDEASAIAVDGNDNIYVTGESTGSGEDRDYATIKYLPDSNQPAWVARYDGPPGDADKALAIAVDGNDNIYITGYSTGSGTSYDYATIKYPSDSNQPAWIARYNGPHGSDDVAYSIAIDGNDNIYVTGRSTGSGTSYDYATIKYSPDSNQPIWVQRYNGPGNGFDEAYFITADSNDNIYLTGGSIGSATSYDYVTIKYSPGYICLQQIPGDLDNDCQVDFYDLEILCQHWLECNLYPPEDCWQ